MVFTISLLKFSDELNFSMRQECPPRNHVNWVDLELKDIFFSYDFMMIFITSSIWNHIINS